MRHLRQRCWRQPLGQVAGAAQVGGGRLAEQPVDIALTELIRQAGQRLAGTAAGLYRIAEALETERFDQVIPRAEALRRAHGLDLRSGGDQHGIGVAVLRAQMAQHLQPGAIAQVDVEQKQVHRLALQQLERGRHALALADQLDAFEPGQVIDVQAHDHRVVLDDQHAHDCFHDSTSPAALR